MQKNACVWFQLYRSYANVVGEFNSSAQMKKSGGIASRPDNPCACSQRRCAAAMLQPHPVCTYSGESSPVTRAHNIVAHRTLTACMSFHNMLVGRGKPHTGMCAHRVVLACLDDAIEVFLREDLERLWAKLATGFAVCFLIRPIGRCVARYAGGVAHHQSLEKIDRRDAYRRKNAKLSIN